MNLPRGTSPWPAAPAEPRLARHEIHVWALSLGISSDVLASLTATLSHREKERAAKFKFDLHRNRFVAGRGQLRTVLGRYLRNDPSKVEFAYSPRGKPGLEPKSDGGGLYFNLAHAEDLALVAITRAGPIGVDVECIRQVEEMDDLVAKFFSPRENELFRKVPPSDRLISFFNLWTRKEALLKATGEGITCSLNLIEVSFLPNEPARVLNISGDSGKAASWSLQALSPAPNFVGAVAIQTRKSSFSCWSNNDHSPAFVRVGKM